MKPSVFRLSRFSFSFGFVLFVWFRTDAELDTSCVFSVGVAPPHPGFVGLCTTGNSVNTGVNVVNSGNAGMICDRRSINVWSGL